MSPLAQDLSNLPREGADRQGCPPDAEPRFVHLLVREMAAFEKAEGPRPTAYATRIRHSDAGKCARAIAYRAIGVEGDPMDLPGVWVTSLGTIIHEHWQQALVAKYPNARIEARLRIDGLDASGHADAVIDMEVPCDSSDEVVVRALRSEGRAPDGNGMLGVDGGSQQGELRGDRGRVPESAHSAGASSVVGTAAGSDPAGPRDRSPLPEPGMREPSAPRAGDAEGERPAEHVPVGGARPQDALPEGSSLRRDEHPPSSEPEQSGVPRVQATRTKRVLIELKTTGGFSWKKKVGDRGQAEGPSYEHILQASLNGLAVDADEIVIAYIATEAISKQAARGKKHLNELNRFCAEWTFTREQFEPLARAEMERLQGILDVVDGGELPRRRIPSPELPKGAEIVDAASGRWEVKTADGLIADTGTFWACTYCSFQSLCATTKPGRIPITDVTGAAVAS